MQPDCVRVLFYLIEAEWRMYTSVNYVNIDKTLVIISTMLAYCEFQSIYNPNTTIFIQQNQYENVVCKSETIMLWSEYVKQCIACQW